MKHAQEIKDGFCPFMCVPQPTYRGTGTIEFGEIAMDKMKLQSGLGYNVKNDDLTALLADFHDLTKIVKNLLDDEVVEEESTPAVHVNQYCFRSTSGRIYPVMFFFNSGSLPANVALQQLFLVIFSCELIGLRVKGLLSDAGGISSSYSNIYDRRGISPRFCGY